METIERIKKDQENALAHAEGGNISLWEVPDNVESREYWKEIRFEAAISERNKTIDEVNYIIIDYLNDSSDNALQTFNERILGLKIDIKG